MWKLAVTAPPSNAHHASAPGFAIMGFREMTAHLMALSYSLSTNDLQMLFVAPWQL